MRFDGSNDLLTRAENFLDSSSGLLAAVFRLNTPAANYETIFSSGDEASSTRYLQLMAYYDGTRPYMAVGQRNNDVADSIGGCTPDFVGLAVVALVASDGSAYKLRNNGRQETLLTLAGGNNGDWLGDSTARDSFAIGANKRSTEGSFFKGDLAELILYDNDPGSSAYAKLEAYLAAKYGISLFPINPNNAASAHAAAPLTTPTYDGSGQCTHPDVLYFPNRWNGYEYWMVMTPFPLTDNDYENPSILVSHDGTSWEVPAGLTNPIEPFPGNPAYNSDPDLIVDQNGVMWCIWRYCNDVDLDIIYARSSADGVTWSAKIELFRGAKAELCSPGAAWDGTQYAIWYLNINTFTLWKRTATSIDGTWPAAVQCNILDVTGNLDHFNINVIQPGKEYHAFILSNTIGLFFAVSPDGLNWTVGRNVMLTMGAGGTWDDGKIYRASGIRTATGYDLWYGARNASYYWYIGRTTVTGI